MSRIHDALAKARGEGAVRQPRPEPVRKEDAVPGRAAPPGAPLHQLPETAMRTVRFSDRALAVLARSYEDVERFCSLNRGPVVGREAGPARTLLVAGLDGEAGADSAALAVAATLVEKAKSRVVLVDGDFVARELIQLCQTDPAGPGLRDLAHRKSELGSCLFRTELAGLYVIPAGTPSADGEGEADGEGLEWALAFLLEHFHFVVVHAGGRLDDPRVVGLTRLADAALLVAADPETTLQEAPELLPLRNLPLRVIRDVGPDGLPIARRGGA